MIYKNIEIHNVAEIFENDDGSISWRRVPSEVAKEMQGFMGDRTAYNSTGVELRFVIVGESVTIRMSTADKKPNSFAPFHIFRGGIQGGWSDHEVHCQVTENVEDFVIERSKNMGKLQRMTDMIGHEFAPEVVRIIFDRGACRIYDVIGDVTPPTPEQLPKKTLLAYGSSITHGSNALDMSHAWVSMLGHNLNMDVRNLGMAGSCRLEGAMADYIASEGERGHWDIATLELGINVLTWSDEEIIEKVENMLRQVAGRNPDKKVFVISPFYYCGDDFDEVKHGDRWRRHIEAITTRLAYPNVTYINGLDCIGDISSMSADGVHPNIYGVERIARVLTERIQNALGDEQTK